MQQVTLSQGQVALVDDADFPLLADFKWCYRPERNGKQGYAVRHAKVDGKDRLLYLHRQLMNPQSGYEVIFLNHNRLDCQRSNLRVVTTQEARQHHRVRRDSKSGIRVFGSIRSTTPTPHSCTATIAASPLARSTARKMPSLRTKRSCEVRIRIFTRSRSRWIGQIIRRWFSDTIQTQAVT